MVQKFISLSLVLVTLISSQESKAQIPGCTPDLTRPVTATFSGTTAQTYNNVPVGNVIAVNLQANRRYTFTTLNADTSADSRLTLLTLNTPGADRIGHNDDSGPGNLSQLSYTSATATTVYLYLTCWDTELTFGCVTDTTLTFGINITTQSVTLPSNDNCSNATNLTVGASCITGNNTNSTPDLGGATLCGSPLDRSVWYKFTATSAHSKVTVSNSVIGINLAVLNSCTDNNPSCATDVTTDRVVFLNTTVGQVYYILVDGYNSAEGTFCIKVENFTPIANDNCSGATTLTLGAPCVQGTNVGSTPEPVQQNNCGSSNDKGVWYKFTATADYSRVVVDETSALDVIIGIYETCADQFDFDCIDNFTEGEELSFATSVGTTYYVLISGYNGDFGTFCVSVENVIPPANNNCGQATVLTVNGLAISGTNIDAFPDEEVAPFNCLNNISVPSVWYKFTATGSNSTVTIDTNASVDVVLSIHHSCLETAFICYDNDTATFGEQITFNTIAGETYYVYVGGYSTSSMGNFSIKVSSNTVSILEEKLIPIHLYPNPAQDKVTIEIKNHDIGTSTFCSIYNLTGQIVQKQGVTTSNFTIDINTLPTGMYILELNNSTGILSRIPFIIK